MDKWEKNHHFWAFSGVRTGTKQYGTSTIYGQMGEKPPFLGILGHAAAWTCHALAWTDECKTHLCFEFISHAILCILYPYSCKTHKISSKLGFVGLLVKSK